MKKTDLAYIAAIIDGEGCIDTFINKRRVKRAAQIRVTITNTSFLLVDWIRRQFPKRGTLRVKTKAKLKRKTSYRIRFVGRGAIYVLERVIPYLKIKKKQAILGIGFSNYFVGCGFRRSEKQLYELTKLRSRIKKLNNQRRK